MSLNLYDNFLRHGDGRHPCDPPRTLGEALSPGVPIADADDIARTFDVPLEDVEEEEPRNG